MLEEEDIIVWVEERLDSILTLDRIVGNVLCGIHKKLWTSVFCSSKSIVISEASTNVIQMKVSTMLEADDVIVRVGKRLHSISNLDGSVENVLYGIRKKLWTSVFCTSKSIVISEASTNAFKTKVSTMLEEEDIIVWVEERLDSISAVAGIVRDVLYGIRKKLWTSVFWTSKSIVISEVSTNGI